MDNSYKKLLKDKISKLNNKEAYVKIYNILKNNKVNLNINSNKIYFNLNSIDCEILKEIENIVNLNMNDQSKINKLVYTTYKQNIENYSN
jgi:hypothetical protein